MVLADFEFIEFSFTLLYIPIVPALFSRMCDEEEGEIKLANKREAFV